jgi:predicted dehydrogenase
MSQSGYSFRYLASGLQLKRFLEDKPVGTANVVRWGGMPQTPWWRKYAESGGQLVEMTTHQVDLLRWVMGEVEAVSASYSFGRLLAADQSDVTVPDTQTALLHFRSGASATISTPARWATRFGARRSSLSKTRASSGRRTVFGRTGRPYVVRPLPRNAQH